MRITGGRLRGRRLNPFKGTSIRPTSDRVREAVFNLLGQDLGGWKVLDLFAGTGCLGIESISRGAQWVLFVDDSPASLQLLRKNLRSSGCEGLAEVAKKDLMSGLPRRCERMLGEIDLVFLDPPYGKGCIPPLLTELSNKGILGAAATVVAESSKAEDLPEHAGRLALAKTRIYGDTKVSLYRYE